MPMKSINTINFLKLIVIDYNQCTTTTREPFMFNRIISEILENISFTLADYGQCKG